MNPPRPIRSMTGFGRARVKLRAAEIAVEVQSVNHRHLAVKAHLPESLGHLALEKLVHDRVRARLVRGSVTVSVRSEFHGREGRYEIDEQILIGYARRLRRVARQAGFPADLSLAPLLTLPGVMRPAPEPPRRRLERLLSDVLDAALARLCASREAEGKRLVGACRSHADRLSVALRRFARREPIARARLARRVRRRLQRSTGSAPPLEAFREAWLETERHDTTEELTRIRSHLDAFRRVLARGGAVGRSLEFLCQELAREANTLTSKVQAADLLPAALLAKAQAEKLREQVANLE